MNQILGVLFPSSIGTIIYIKNASKENTGLSIIGYMINTLLTNMIAMYIYYILYNTKTFNFTNIFTLKYMLVSIIISIFIGIIMTLINKYLNLKIEVVKNEKKNKTNTKNNK